MSLNRYTMRWLPCAHIVGVVFLILPVSAVCEKLVASVEIASIKAVAPVNRMVFGNNVIGNKIKYQVDLFNKTGGGLWDPDNDKPNPIAVKLIKDAGIDVLRWPGGGWKGSFNLEELVGPAERRKHHTFGLPEFMKLCEEVGAEALITLPPEREFIRSGAGLVAYLNGRRTDIVDERYRKWAELREKDGRQEPWGVTYFEFGNETYLGSMLAQQYIDNFVDFKRLIENISPNVKLGAVLEDSDNVGSGWTYEVVSQLSGVADFFSIHPYIPKITDKEIKRFGLKKVALSAMASDADLQFRLNEYRRLFDQVGVPPTTKIAVTEFNGHFVQNEPYPLRFSILNTVHNADFIRVFLKPENRIQLAAYWQLVDSYWGMIRLDKRRKGGFSLQSDYLLYALLSDYVFENLVGVSIDSPAYEFEGAGIVSPRLKEHKCGEWQPYGYPIDSKWRIRMRSGADEAQVNGVLRISFNGEEDLNYHHVFKILPAKPGKLYRVNVMAKATDLKGKVGIAVEDARGWSETLYQPSNIQLTGNTSWQRVSVVFKSLVDTEFMRISVRHVKGSGQLSGIVEFKDLYIEEMDYVHPPIDILTGFATASANGKELGFVLINKHLTSSVNVRLFVPNGYRFVNGKVVKGSVFYDTNFGGASRVKTESIGSSLSNEGYWEVVLPPMSVSAVKFWEGYAN